MGIALLEAVPRMEIFLAAFDDIPDSRAGTARHDLWELLDVGLGAVFAGQSAVPGSQALVGSCPRMRFCWVMAM
jgi:hypothetical protein